MSKSHRIFVGTAGWSYPDWKGIFYPKRKPRGFTELTYYATYFDTVEINSTFYRIPTSSTVEKWVSAISNKARFQFNVKLWQHFTHTENVNISKAEVLAFTDSLTPLFSSKHFGALLIQFPWRFKYNQQNADYVARLLTALEPVASVVEFRHGSWASSETFDLLREHNSGFVNIDQPLISDSIAPSAHLIGDIGYIRFHGRNEANWFNENAGRDARYDYLYSNTEIKPWIESIDSITKNANKTFVIFNNHFKGQAVINSLQLLNKMEHKKIFAPDTLLNIFPELKSICRGESSQQTLDLF